MWWRITSVLKGSKGWGKKGYQRGNIYVKMKWQGARVLINVVSLLAAQFNLTSIFDSLFHSRLYVMTYRKKYKNEYLSSYIYLWPTSILKKKKSSTKKNRTHGFWIFKHPLSELCGDSLYRIYYPSPVPKLPHSKLPVSLTPPLFSDHYSPGR